MKEADIDIREVHEDDMKGDPRVWLTKAMTEEQAPRPTGGSSLEGQTRIPAIRSFVTK